MKLLFDENLSPHLVHQLADVFPQSAHVHQLELGAESDQRVWSAAAELGYTLVTKDSDYYDLSLIRGAPPKIVWIRRGNCSTTVIETMLRANTRAIHDLDSTNNIVLVLL